MHACVCVFVRTGVCACVRLLRDVYKLCVTDTDAEARPDEKWPPRSGTGSCRSMGELPVPEKYQQPSTQTLNSAEPALRYSLQSFLARLLFREYISCYLSKL